MIVEGTGSGAAR